MIVEFDDIIQLPVLYIYDLLTTLYKIYRIHEYFIDFIDTYQVCLYVIKYRFARQPIDGTYNMDICLDEN